MPCGEKCSQGILQQHRGMTVVDIFMAVNGSISESGTMR